MKIKYKIENWNTQFLEMKEETFQDICKEFGNFSAYLKSMLHESITYIHYDRGEEMIITSKCNGCDSLLKEIAVGVVLNKEGNDSMDSIVYKTNYEITPTDFLFCNWVCYGKFMDRKFPPVNKIYHKW